MSFRRIWATAYYNPRRAVAGLLDAPAPFWGLRGILLRCAMLSLLWYLPAHLMGRLPSPPSYLTPFPSESYYLTLVWLAPALELAAWLLGGAVSHLVLRLLKQPSDIDQILNIGGMAALIGTLPLVVWDWIYLAAGQTEQVMLWGAVHLLIDFWPIVFTIVAFRQILRLPLWLAVALLGVGYLWNLPLRMLVMRG